MAAGRRGTTEPEMDISDVLERDLYAELGLDANDRPLPSQIRKAYRVTARAVHPDRNKDNPDAAAAFDAVHRAYQVLQDAQARLAYDAARESVVSRKRKRAAEQADRRAAAGDLAARESAARHVKRARVRKAQADQHASRVHKHTQDVLRQEIAAVRAGVGRGGSGPAAVARAAGPGPGAGPNPADPCPAAVLARWDPGVGGGSAGVRAMFEMFGPVESWVEKPPKKPGKPAKALVVMASASAAAEVLSAASVAAFSERGIKVKAAPG